MRLNRRQVYDTTQYLTETGKILAEFNSHTAHAIFCSGIERTKGLTIYDMDMKQVVYGPLEELLKGE